MSTTDQLDLTDLTLEARVEALEAQVRELLARREVRIHAQVAEREQRIVDFLGNQSIPVTVPVIAHEIRSDAKLVDATCRKLAGDGRIVRVAMGGRTPHYAAAR